MTHSPDLDGLAIAALGDDFTDLNDGMVRACEYFTERLPSGEPIHTCPNIAAPGSRLCGSHIEDLQDRRWAITRDAQEVDRG